MGRPWVLCQDHPEEAEESPGTRVDSAQVVSGERSSEELADNKVLFLSKSAPVWMQGRPAARMAGVGGRTGKVRKCL